MNTSLTGAYYALRSSLPFRLRLVLRRGLARAVRLTKGGSWPILECAVKAPKGWSGWPNGKKFAFVLTHDVEGKVGLDRCRQLAEMDKAHGLVSSFNFVPEGEYRVPDSLRLSLADQGFEVGVHDLYHDGSLYRSSRQFQSQSQKINQYLKSWGAAGFRSGFMFHNLDWLQSLDVQYDASTFDTDPFEPQPDGAGTIFPFWVQGEDHRRGFVELPYTLPQDSTLFVLLQEHSIELWKRKLDWVASHGGMAMVIVHPDYICFDGKPTSSEYPAHLYDSLLGYVTSRYQNDCWFALPREVATYVAESRFWIRHNNHP